MSQTLWDLAESMTRGDLAQGTEYNSALFKCGMRVKEWARRKKSVWKLRRSLPGERQIAIEKMIGDLGVPDPNGLKND